MSVYGLTPSPLKHYSRSNLFHATTQAPTGLKRPLEREFSQDSPEKPLSTITAMAHGNTNHESQYWRRRNNQTDVKYSKVEDKARKIIELEQKIDVILRHNTHLLAENGALKETVTGQQIEIDGLRHEVQTLMMESHRPSFDRVLITEQLQRKNYEHRVEVEKLLTEISKLHEQCFQIETVKNLEIQRLKNDYEQASYTQLQNLKRSQHGNNEMYELQIRKLREALEQRNQEREQAAMINKREKQVLLQELSALKADYKHMQQRKDNEIEEIKSSTQMEKDRAEREHRLADETARTSHELAMKKMKKQLGDRVLDIQRLNNRIDSSCQENEFLAKQLRDDKDKLLTEIEKMSQEYEERVHAERVKFQKMAEIQLHNQEKAESNRIAMLEGEIARLKELLQSKSQRLDDEVRLAQQNRSLYSEQVSYLEQHNRNLRKKLDEINQQCLQDIELLKVKMAQLHEADLKGLVAVYEPRIESLSEELSKKTQLLEQLRNQLHDELQKKLHMRKEHELQLSKLRSVVMDLKVQLAAVQVEMKQNVTSLRSKIDFASQSLIADQHIKMKNMKFYDEEMRKLRQAIEAKDNEIALIQDNSNKKQEFYEGEQQRLTEKMASAKKESDERDERKAKELAHKDQEIQALRQELQEQKDQFMNQIAGLKAKIQQNTTDTQSLEELIRRQEKQILQWQQKCRKLEHELALAHGHIETARMESQVNLNDEKQKHRSMNKISEGAIKDFYERKVQELQKDKRELTTINSAQSHQISELVAKYNELQRSLKELLESQRRLTEFQTKVVNLGMDNNLIKNMSQLLRRP